MHIILPINHFFPGEGPRTPLKMGSRSQCGAMQHLSASTLPKLSLRHWMPRCFCPLNNPLFSHPYRGDNYYDKMVLAMVPLFSLLTFPSVLVLLLPPYHIIFTFKTKLLCLAYGRVVCIQAFCLRCLSPNEIDQLRLGVFSLLSIAIGIFLCPAIVRHDRLPIGPTGCSKIKIKRIPFFIALPMLSSFMASSTPFMSISILLLSLYVFLEV